MQTRSVEIDSLLWRFTRNAYLEANEELLQEKRSKNLRNGEAAKKPAASPADESPRTFALQCDKMAAVGLPSPVTSS
jgi:hypothetical protein